MVFQSLEYLVFFAIVLFGSVAFQTAGAAPAGRPWARRAENLWLLVASYVFYGWVTHWWLILIGLHTLVDYTCIRLMERQQDPGRRRAVLAASLIFSFLILATFKYFGFFVENVTAALESVGVSSEWLASNAVARFLLSVGLPAGISFFTFQSAGYVIDVYRREEAPPRDLLDYAVFVAFFPQLVAGPIDRHGRLLRQVEKPRRFSAVQWRSGLVLILWGLLQKIVIADSAALLADKVFALENPTFPILWAGVLCFGVQIYADFSGYTDIARGSARLLGIDLMRNFNHPYLAQSPGDFWRRWHMTLSTWFRDYIFIPLGGSRNGAAVTIRNLVATFFISGLWHGASWNYVLWGLFHGALVAFWPWLARLVPVFGTAGGKAGVVLRVAVTFVLMHIGWLLFREHNVTALGEAFALSPFEAPLSHWRMGLGLAAEAWLYGLPLIVLLPLLQYCGAIPSPGSPQHLTWKWALLQAAAAAACLLVILFLRCEVGSDFIYFAF